MVYGNPNYFRNNRKLDIGILSSKYKIWLAAYYQPSYYGPTYDGHRYKNDTFPKEAFSFQMWQYTSQGRVPGINGYVDLNIAFFSYSGSNVSTGSLQLNLGKTEFASYVGGDLPNLLEGVTAKDTRGADISSKVTYKLYKQDGSEVDLDTAKKTPGSYKIEYAIVDFTGGKLTKTASLKVRKLPDISGLLASYSGNSDETYKILYQRVGTNLKLENTNDDGNTVSLSYVVSDTNGTALIDSSKAESAEKLPAGNYTVKYTLIDKHPTYGEIKREITRELVISQEKTTTEETSTE